MISKTTLLALFLGVALATTGVDISANAVSDMSCLKSKGFSFVIPRAWCSYGAMDPNAVANVNGARSAGF